MRLTELRGPTAGEYEITHEAWRLRLSRLLRRAGALLTRLAAHLERARRARPRPALEFYAEAGAPEGALYVDGHLAGTLPGVRRL